MNRAFLQLDIKDFNNAKRTFRGIASSVSVDRQGDVLEPEGVTYSLPIPMMWQHGHSGIDHPVGWIRKVTIDKKQISVEGEFAQVNEPPQLKENLDMAWALVNSNLVRGLSVGFREIESEPIKGSSGRRFSSWEWLELSPVAIAANQDSMITTFKSFDDFVRAASGTVAQNIVRLDLQQTPAGASASSPKHMTIREHMTALESKRAADTSRMNDIQELVAKDGRTLNETEAEEFDTLQAEVETIDKDLKRYRATESLMIAKATPVLATTGAAAAVATAREPITVKSMAPKGVMPARMAIAMWHAKNNAYAAAELARKHWPDMPEVEMSLKAIVEAGDTTTSGWASQLLPAAQQLQQEFIDMYRPATIIGRIPGLRRVPFNVAVPLRTAAGTFQWVGEAAPKPVTSETFDRVTLTYHKAAAITVITKELAKFSSPSAETLIRDSMRETLIRFLDAHFISTTAAVVGVSPAGILNGISAVTASGTTAATFRTDLNNMLNNFTANNVPLSRIVLIMSSTQAVALSLIVTDLGVPLFPQISREGGNLAGFPVIISEAAGTRIIALNPDDILLAEDPGITVSVSDQATIEMETTPAVGEQSPPSTQSVLKSMFQNNMIAILCEQFMTWVRARTSAVEYINGNAYVP